VNLLGDNIDIVKKSIETSIDNTVGISHMNDIRQMSVAMQRLVDFISMVTNSYVTMQQYRTVRYYATILEWSQLWKETAISVRSALVVEPVISCRL
jgi:hypothetical protein